jgi:hypothetical protein
MHAESKRLISFILICDDLDRAGWVVMSAIKGIHAIGLPHRSTTIIQENLNIPPQLISIVSDIDLSKEFPEAAKFVLSRRT